MSESPTSRMRRGTARRAARASWGVAAVTMMLAAGSTIAGAQPAVRDTVLEARTTALAAVLRCPVCQGLSVHDSPTELAQQMRAVVREQLAAGKSEREVKAYFVSKYGEWILLSPEPRGFNLVVYALPVALLLTGIGLVTFVVKRWTAAPAASGAAAAGRADPAPPGAE